MFEVYVALERCRERSIRDEPSTVIIFGKYFNRRSSTLQQRNLYDCIIHERILCSLKMIEIQL